MFDAVILSCEHAGNAVPEEYQQIFEGAHDVLESHRGWDPGALELAQYLSQKLVAPLFFATTTRLLIELNRSPGMHDWFSEYSSNISQKDKEETIAYYYKPYREATENAIKKSVESGKKTLHLSVHSCTPVLNGSVRYLDLGILFDPDREIEQIFADKLKEKLLDEDGHLDIKYNYPYLGLEDGFTTFLRKKYSPELYAGIEVEINQKYPLFEPREKWQNLMAGIAESLKKVLNIEG